jgi:hypothetical protein
MNETPPAYTLPPGVPDSAIEAKGCLDLVEVERHRQRQRWGISRNLHPQLWLPVLTEEVGEVSKAILKGNPANYEEELVHVAAVALAALEDWRWQQRWRRQLPPPQLVAFGWQRMELEGNA